MNTRYALVILVYGLCLTAGTAFWMRSLGEAWRRVRRTFYVFVGFLFLLTPLPGIVHWFTGLDNGWLILWMVPIEEALKLALVVRLGASGRRAVAICLFFASFEVIASKTLMALVTPPFMPLWFVFVGVTLAVVMHCATGFIHAEIRKVRRGILFSVAALLHLINNASVLYILAHASGVMTAFGMEMCVMAVILACTIGFREATRHLPVREAAAPDMEAETLAVGQPFV